MSKINWRTPVRAGALALFSLANLSAQEPLPPQKLTLKQAVALAVENSREVALARVRQNVAEKTAAVDRAPFRPNFYGGSGAAYTRGFPLTAAGGAPSIFNTSFVVTVLNPPLRGEVRAAEERAEAQRLGVDQARDTVIARAASAYLELVKVRHSLDLLRRERASAQKIVDLTRERRSEGLELPMELTRVQLSAARVEQLIVHLEGREDALEADLRAMMGLPADQPIEVAPEELPVGGDQSVRDLIAMALANNVELKQAEAERRAREHRLKGERGGYWPTVDLVSEYSLYSKANNFDQFFRRFQRNSLNFGIAVRIPIFSARTSAEVALAKSNLSAAEIELKTKRSDLEREVRRQAHRTRELDANREVARLALQLAQENLRVLQVQFEEGRLNLREVEKARLEESDKWMAFLDSDYERQQAQLELLRMTGQLARVFQ
ncbi:MAG TPA: TolC family protein [Candidatus Acidoferrales bacterium]|nr:TolC family protein [Candidatus Acidoferrales bacterium]